MKRWPWPQPTDDGGCRHLTRGRPMPSLPLPATRGPAVDLSTIPGRAIVFCYPWTGAPGVADPPGWDAIPGAHGSTAQARDFARLHSAYVHMKLPVFGMSLQPTAWQAAFADREQLPFPLLSDSDRRFTDALGLPTFETGGTTYLKRATLILSDGRLEKVFYPVHPPDTHAREVLAWAGATYRLNWVKA